MPFDAEIHHRQSMRLREYDYTQEGAYFVTICTQNRECRFGKIKNEEMKLNEVGGMIEKWWKKLPNKFPTIQIDEFIIMPNHFHGIIIIVGADPCVRPQSNCAQFDCVRPNNTKSGTHMGVPLPKMIQWFKIMTTNEYIRNVKQNNWVPFPGRLWQRNYYEHIIRDEDDLNRIHEYIMTNPSNWKKDENYEMGS